MSVFEFHEVENRTLGAKIKPAAWSHLAGFALLIFSNKFWTVAQATAESENWSDLSRFCFFGSSSFKKGPTAPHDRSVFFQHHGLAMGLGSQQWP